jgi:hypothetical protein
MISTTRSSTRRASVVVGLVGGLVLMAACAGTTPSSLANAQAARLSTTAKPVVISKKVLLHPKLKYYGISVSGAPSSLGPIKTVAKQTGRTPNLVMYYQDWGRPSVAAAGTTTNFSPAGPKLACNAGLLPMMTWESWYWGDTTGGNGVNWNQTAYSIANVLSGKYDAYITKTAEAMKALNCPIALRFDQEPNGYWYPWGYLNTTVNGPVVTTSAAAYIKMWRHVYGIFAKVGATNVLWVWSPNVVPHTANSTAPKLSASYPGRSYVDWIGIDGYYTTDHTTFASLFNPTIAQVTAIAPHKPWLIGETGVATGPNKPAQIKDLLTSVAKDSRFNGFIYLDSHKASDRSNWPFTTTPQALAAFKYGVANPVFAQAIPGSL